MDDIAEILTDLNKTITILNGIVNRASLKLLEYVEAEEIDKIFEGKEEAEKLLDKYKT